MKLIDREQVAGGPFGWLLAFFIAYCCLTVATWRAHEDFDVDESHQAQHESLIQYVGSQGRYIERAVLQIWQ